MLGGGSRKLGGGGLRVALRPQWVKNEAPMGVDRAKPTEAPGF